MHNNPFRKTLLVIACLGAVLAVVIALIAAAVGVQYPTGDAGFDEAYLAAQRAPYYLVAGWLFGVAVASILLWLHASSISWAAENPSPPVEAEEDAG